MKIQNGIAIVCFFLSGFAGLVYEVSWIRKASLVFGSTTFAVSTVLAVFFLGLACGSYLFGRIGQRTLRPLRLYALIEVGLGLFAMASPYLLDFTESLYGPIYRALAGHAVILFVVRGVLVSLVILPPTILMGSTLPLFCRQFVRSDAKVANSVGMLYGVNTLGAAVGCAAAGLFLLPTFGLRLTVQLGAALNILCGIAVGLLPIAKSQLPQLDRDSERSTSQGKTVKERFTAAQVPIAILFFSVGFVVLGSEVLWTRYLRLLTRQNNVYTYTLTLTVVLVGIVLGSFLASRLFDRSTPRARYFGLFQILTGLSVLTVMTLPHTFWAGVKNELGMYFLLLLPPAILSGASFPLAVRMVVEDASRVSIGTGRMAAINTLGGILGSLLIGFVGLPIFGIKFSLLFITGVSLLTGFAAWFWIDKTFSPLFRGGAVAGALLIWICLPFASRAQIPADFLADGRQLVAFREGFDGDLAVIRRDEEWIELEIDRWWQGSNLKNQQVVGAHIPMLLHPNPKNVLVVGAGTGQTPSRFLMYDIDHLDCVDIEPTLFEFIRSHFDSKWMADERVKLISEDGLNYLNHSDAMYDVIAIEVGQIFRPGIAFFYTADFYHRSRQRLRPGGLLTQLVSVPSLTTDQFQGVIKTFLDAFPQSFLWYNSSDLLLIGINDADFKLSRTALERLLSNQAVHQDLRYTFWGGPQHWLNQLPVFLGGYLAGPHELADLASEGRLYRDNLPVLDYATSLDYIAEMNEIPIVKDYLLKHTGSLDEVIDFALSAEKISAIEEVRKKNLGAIIAEAVIRRAELLTLSRDDAADEVITLLSEAVGWNPDHFEANRVFADALIGQGRNKAAGRHYVEANRIRPEDPHVLHGIAHTLYRLGRIEAAIPYYRTSLRLRPNHAETHNHIGLALAKRGNFVEARQHFKTAVRLDPDYAEAKHNLAGVRKVLQSTPQR